MELTTNILEFVGEMDGNILSVRAYKGSMTSQVSKGNDYAIVTKIKGDEIQKRETKDNQRLLNADTVGKLEALNNEKFEALQAMFNSKY